MPCVIRVEKFEVLYNIATYLLLKVVGNLNNIQSYMYITKLLLLKKTTYTNHTSSKHLRKHMASTLILSGLCCDVIITGWCGDPNNCMHTEVTAGNMCIARTSTYKKYIYIPS